MSTSSRTDTERSRRTPDRATAAATIIALSLCSSLVALSATVETEHFHIQGDIPADRIETIHTIFSERIFLPDVSREKISVRIDPRLCAAGLDGKAYANHISLASFDEKTFIHEMAHYLWEIRGWKPRPWLAGERARLRSKHPLVREEYLNHYLIYEYIVPRVEELLGEP